jgi:hypothetical protein
MAFRPYENLIDGELDNTVPGKVTGWIRFFRRGKPPLEVTLDLDGDAHRDLQGRRFRFFNPDPREDDPDARDTYLDGFAAVQKGQTGDMTAGWPPCDYVDYPYLEWYAENGRVVLELGRDQLEVLTPEPTFPPHALDRGVQHEHMAKFLSGMAAATGAPFVGVVGDASERPKRRRAA